MRRNTPKGLVFGFSVVALVLALTSVAFACTEFRGKMVVTGGGGTSTVYGNGSSMGYSSTCSSTAGAKGSSGSTITVTVSSASSTCNSKTLPAYSNYKVTFIGGGAYTWNGSGWARQKDCMYNGGDVGTTTIGSMSVSSTGYGTGSYSLPSGLTKNSSSDLSAVCVSDPVYNPSLYGNQAPIAII